MFRKIHFIIICFIFGFIFHCSGNEGPTDGQKKLFEINKKIEEKLNNGEQCNNNYFNENLLPLLKEVITRGQIWEDDKPVDDLPSFQSFLSSSIGNHSNPYFTYAWWCYISSERFKCESLEARQKTCNVILKMLNDDMFKKHHEFLYWTLFTRCCKNNCFNEHSRNLAQKIIMKHKNKYSIRLLLFLDRKDLDKETLDYVMEQAALAPNIAKPKRHYPNDPALMFFENRIPFVSLVFLAKDGEQKYLKSLLSLLHKDGQFIDFELAKYLFPYLIFVRQKEVVLILKEYLKDDTIIDQGDDVMHRFTGYWQIAALSLYMMVENFPVISIRHLNQVDRQKAAVDDQRKCLEWMERHPSYNFRESIDWKEKDEATQYLKFMLYDR